jgi:hypothetical protein
MNYFNIKYTITILIVMVVMVSCSDQLVEPLENEQLVEKTDYTA